MLSHSRTFLGFACIVLFLSIFPLVGSFSPSYQKCEADSSGEQARSRQGYSQQERAGGISDMLAVFIRCEGAFFDENNAAILGAVGTLATVAIAAFTLTLKQSTDRLWEVTDRSVKIAERALTDLERAYVYFTRVSDPGFELPRGRSAVTMRDGLKYTITNHGRTPAILTEVVGRHFLSKESKIFDLPPPIGPANEGGQLLPNGIGVGAGQSYELGYPLLILPQDVSRYLALSSRETDLFFMGYIRYADIFGKSHRTGFCLAYNESVADFFAVGGEEYNYTVDED